MKLTQKPTSDSNTAGEERAQPPRTSTPPSRRHSSSRRNARRFDRASPLPTPNEKNEASHCHWKVGHHLVASSSPSLASASPPLTVRTRPHGRRHASRDQPTNTDGGSCVALRPSSACVPLALRLSLVPI